jgi:hypothetical protein
MRPRLLSAISALVLALAVSWVPVGVAHACSCLSLGGPVDAAMAAAREASIAFTGTVVGARPAPQPPGGFGSMVAYAFEVDHASDDVETPIEVHALDDGGGASCGFTFGIGEEWFVTASVGDGALQTNLCSGNLRLADLNPAEAEQLRSVLPEQPAAGGPAQPAGFEVPWVLILVLSGLAAAVGLTVFAFRGDARR